MYSFLWRRTRWLCKFVVLLAPNSSLHSKQVQQRRPVLRHMYLLDMNCHTGDLPLRDLTALPSTVPSSSKTTLIPRSIFSLRISEILSGPCPGDPVSWSPI